MSAAPVAVPTITLAFGYIIVFNTDIAPWLGSMPPSRACNQLHSHRPLNAKVYSRGAAKQS